MALMQNIGGIRGGLSDGDIITDAAGYGSMRAGGIGATAAPPVTVAEMDLGPALWAAGGLGAAYLLSHAGPAIAGTVGKKKSMLLPVLALGGFAAWYFFFRKPTAPVIVNPGTTAISTQGGGGAPLNVVEVDRQWLLNTYHASNVPNDTALKAAIALMTDDEVVGMYNVIQFVQSGQGALPANLQFTYDAIMKKYNLAGL